MLQSQLQHFDASIMIIKSNMVLENKHDLFIYFSYFWLLFSVAVFDQLDLVTYEEVVKLPAFKRKTLVLLGNFLNMTFVL